MTNGQHKIEEIFPVVDYLVNLVDNDDLDRSVALFFDYDQIDAVFEIIKLLVK